MKIIPLAVSLSVLTTTGLAQFAHDPAPPPRAEKRPRDVTVHGDRRVDDYFWLREKESPAVTDYLKAENAHAEAVMAPNAPLRKKLYDEIVGRIKETDSRPPVERDGYWYYSRTEQGRQYPILARRKGTMEAPEQVTLDLNKLAEGQTFMALGHYEISDNSRLLAYSTDTTGYRQYRLFLLDLESGQTRDLGVERVTSVEWAKDNRTLFLTQEDPVSKRSHRVGRLDLDSGELAWQYEEADEMYDVGLYRSLDQEYLFLLSQSKVTTEVRALPSGENTAPWRVVAPRREGVEIYPDHRAGRFYFRTNDGATNFRVVTAPVDQPEPEHWTEFIPHNPAVKIDDLLLFAEYTAVNERENGLPHIRVLDAGNKSHRIELPEPTYEIDFENNPEAATARVRYTYQSLVTPRTVVSYDMGSHEATVLKQDEIPSGYDASKYQSERVWATAADGVKVPVSLVYRRDLRKDGPQPLFLTAYGSYGYSHPVTFGASRLSLLDRGVVFAIAHIRGGGEFGEPWRDAGKMERKMTTFTDFIACAEHLVGANYTSSKQLVINGGSAGGLLMGVVVNLRPELWRAAIYDVPFVDVVNTMLDASLPLTTAEYVEWGNPNLPEEYAWIRAYSPYDNLRASAYPHILVLVSINDSQVPYWEGAKLVAKLRDLKTDDNVLLLHTNLSAGHGGASGRYDAIKETAYRYAFALSALGLAE